MITDYIYKDLTYKIIGCLYEMHRELGSVHKEIIYHKALAIELRDRNIPFTEEKSIDVEYKGKKIGLYRPDFIIRKPLAIAREPCYSGASLVEGVSASAPS